MPEPKPKPTKESCGRLASYFKRRWILLTCVVVLLACGCFDLHYRRQGTFTNKGSGLIWTQRWGLSEGNCMWTCEPDGTPMILDAIKFKFHAPVFGDRFPQLEMTGSHQLISFPIWLPLCALIGWLAICEMGVRETSEEDGDPNAAT